LAQFKKTVDTKASGELKHTVMPDFIELVKKKIQAVREYEQAWMAEEKLRQSFSEQGLKDILPFIDWPGMKPLEFSRQREALQYRLEQSGLADILE